MSKRLQKTVISLLLCAAMLVINCPAMVLAVDSICTGAVDCKATKHEVGCLGQNNIDSLIAQLPEVSDPMGTEYYFYNQLSDIEKVMYWKMSEATWENPEIVISGLDGYMQEELHLLTNRAWVALSADAPRYCMYWERYATKPIAFEYGVFTFSLWQNNVASDYLIRKAEATIHWFVETIGVEGDSYTRLRELCELIDDEMTYCWNYDYVTERADAFLHSSFGCLINKAAVCDGFSDTLKILCDELSIPCIVVGNAGHAWNFVRMEDDCWYSVDTAGDDILFKLVGSLSNDYQASNYHWSDLYLGNPDDFTFPELALYEYQYPHAYSAQYHSVENDFIEPEGTFVYVVNDNQNTCTIIAYEGLQSDSLIIPQSIDGYLVTGIGDGAFYYCNGFDGDLIIPETVSTIGNGAFQNCSGLVGNLCFSQGLISIGSLAFAFSDKLTGNIDLPNSVQSIGENAFFNCSGLNGYFYVPDNLKYFSNNVVAGTNISAFQTSSNNKLFTHQDGILYTKDMKKLVACAPAKSGILDIPAGVEVIGDKACYACKNLTSVVFPDGLKVIEHEAFRDCNLRGDLIFPDSVEIIDSEAFYYAVSNGKIQLSKKLKLIGNYAFALCNFHGDLIIPEGVEQIGARAFSVTDDPWFGGNLELPSTLVFIGEYGISGHFSNSVDLSNSNVQLAPYAFRDAVLTKDFKCNCGIEYTVILRDEPNCYSEGTERIGCSNCYGGIKVTLEKVHTYTQSSVSPTCTEHGYTSYNCSVCGDTYTGNTVTKLGHDMGQWTVVKEATPAAKGQEKRTCSRCDHVETRELIYKGNVLAISAKNLLNPESVWINGVQCAVIKDGNTCYITMPEGKLTNMVSYSYNENNPKDIHTQYPTGMQVWRLTQKADGTYSATHVKELDNILQYAGSSIRITGTKGIRMITSIEKSKKTALTGSGLAGYKLVEYGTALCWAKDLKDNKPMVLGHDYVKSNYAYKRGVADPVFAQTNTHVQYTNVLVGFNLDQCKDDIAMRPYIILEDAKGQQITIYGGIVYRSIGYIAYQNRTVFKPGNASYDYVWEIIHHVYGKKYDADFKG